jgi:hypothetical protein
MESIVKVSQSEKYKVNPFLNNEDIITIDKGKKQIITGRTNDVLVNTETGEVNSFTFLHKTAITDKNQFAKLYIAEIQSLFELSKTGIKVFGYVLSCLKKDSDNIYIHIPALMEYCHYKQKNQAYKGLGELIKNNIIALSTMNCIWFINPKIIFNGNRIAFVKEYRLTEPKQLPIQQNLEFEETKLIEKK